MVDCPWIVEFFSVLVEAIKRSTTLTDLKIDGLELSRYWPKEILRVDYSLVRFDFEYARTESPTVEQQILVKPCLELKALFSSHKSV